MSDVKTMELAEYLRSYLRVDAIPDSAQALNGLQFENSGTVTRVAVAVDASERAIRAAAERGCNLLLTHHGMFWDGNIPATGARYRKIRQLIDADLAVYSSHIPLDVHPEVGNNAELARAIELPVAGTFGSYKGIELGVWGELEIRRESLAARLDDVLGVRVKLIPGGREIVTKVGIVTGAAAGMMAEAVALGLDAFITGEGTHHTYSEAEERGINLYYGGHYATETWGVKALGRHIEERFGLPWEFLDLPTGL